MINKKIINSFLKHYGLDKAKYKPISSGLSSFALMIPKEDEKYILKIYNRNSNIETEAQFGNYLHNQGIPTAKIIKNLKGRLITTIDDLSCVLFEFCYGDQIEWNNINPIFSENLAEIISKMHLLMLNNTQIPAKDYSKYKIDDTFGLSNQKIIQKSKEIKNIPQNLTFSNFRRGLIHSDLTRQNILATKDRNKVNAIIDFGDAHTDYFCWDIAVLITHIYITKTYGIDWDGLSTFIKKYFHLFPLSKQEINSIVPFIKIRNINLAIEVNRLALNKSENIKKLLSIENSVMSKLDLIDKNQSRLIKIINN